MADDDLELLIDPPGNICNIDIIAVHGLNPKSSANHARNTWTAGGKLWLQDFLPSQIPSARGLLLSYNSRVALGTSTAGVNQHATNLLNLLWTRRRTPRERERPIIFIAHSLGGIIVKRALTLSTQITRYRSIQSWTYGIAFFATPHRGAAPGVLTVGSIAANIARAVSSGPPNSLLAALRANDYYAQTIEEDFRHTQESYQILSIIETIETPGIGIVVPRHSATLGLGGDREIPLEIQRNHANVCKFASDTEPACRQVIDNLKIMAEEATGQTIAGYPALGSNDQDPLNTRQFSAQRIAQNQLQARSPIAFAYVTRTDLSNRPQASSSFSPNYGVPDESRSVNSVERDDIVEAGAALRAMCERGSNRRALLPAIVRLEDAMLGAIRRSGRSWSTDSNVRYYCLNLMQNDIADRTWQSMVRALQHNVDRVVILKGGSLNPAELVGGFQTTQLLEIEH